MGDGDIFINTDALQHATVYVPKNSPWVLYLTQKLSIHFVEGFIPPNWFQRKMQEIVFGFKWVKEER